MQHGDVRCAVDRQHRTQSGGDRGRWRGSGAGPEKRSELVEEGADVGEQELEEVLSCDLMSF